MKVQFKYYLHDDKDSWYDELESLLNMDELNHLSETEKENLRQNIGMPFYEVTFM
jgi:hypothetical protein